ncbi:phosphotransferase [Amycolatopsis sp. 195334CR]|uniref:phosphotransferase n=1 Tax=Amycolatopsis sp. 195334CR TaxID=2814588 RepID=UPI001A8F7AF7|nr:phosphotransferase [Amycolatopsis sp. 195334CR]MBN6038707.1 phosphotransferase [Amycolatopsis sp. 195334CR]
MLHTWDDLPTAVRAAIEAEAGSVTDVEVPAAGRNSDFAATLHTGHGMVFCKGIADAGGKRGRMHRHEADINPYLPPAVAPRLLWRAEADDWLLLGFQHITGHYADLSPDSPDLPFVAEAVSTMDKELAACAAPGVPELAKKMAWLSGWRRLRHQPPAELDRWSHDRLDLLVAWEADGVDAAAGDSLVHTDLHPLNLLVDDRRAWVIDWAWSHTGAAWVDAAHLVVRLIDQGHSPDAAESWAATTAAWSAASAEALTAFSVALLGTWTYLQHTDPLPMRARLTTTARRWAEHRLAVTERFTG